MTARFVCLASVLLIGSLQGHHLLMGDAAHAADAPVAARYRPGHAVLHLPRNDAPEVPTDGAEAVAPAPPRFPAEPRPRPVQGECGIALDLARPATDTDIDDGAVSAAGYASPRESAGSTVTPPPQVDHATRPPSVRRALLQVYRI